jgi:glycerol-3-phosphate dehydrogenase
MDVSKQVTKKMQNSIHKYGATIYYDGWNNVARCPLLNVMFACPSGDVFIGSIDTTRE